MEQHGLWMSKISSKIWTTYLILASLVLGFSSSPFTGIFFLVTCRLGLSLKIGLSSRSWFFFTLVIIYLGGMIVMFVYLSRLAQSAKVYLLGGHLLRVFLVLPLTYSLILFKVQIPFSLCWVEIGFSYFNISLLVFILLYLLQALFRVCRLCEKSEGPMKNA